MKLWIKLLLACFMMVAFFYSHEVLHQVLFSYGGIHSETHVCSTGICTSTDDNGLLSLDESPTINLVLLSQYLADALFYTLLVPFMILLFIWLDNIDRK